MQSLLFFPLFLIFIYLFLAVLALRCCVRAFSGLSGATLPSGAQASLVAEHGLQGAQASGVVFHGLQSTGSKVVGSRLP